MKERPILFNAPMVKAILEGRKTQTRRSISPQPSLVMGEGKHSTYAYRGGMYALDLYASNSNILSKCPFGKIGDRLWVRETFRLFDSEECPHADFPCGCPSWGTPLYRASHDCGDGEKWTPSIHMPRSASRILLEITKIRVERLQDISESDYLKEGVGSPILRYCKKPKFMQLWESINGADSWAANPWVWVVEFKVIQGGAA
ncbi:hypothetical protein C3F34_13965 [Acinetobacter sp. ACNIH2]|uniref:hypothetical protein n=1 Tax=Acinetobacter sp. ACNIH2 TaxID=1758189 RepID=UPI000CDCA8D3|nr:hypothetical protein [Acinetobacter sp. ACNIH2]AUX87028.1 hypothetical protein C3F34_13965 [Acinetobacter sp. ACNIH2]